MRSCRCALCGSAGRSPAATRCWAGNVQVGVLLRLWGGLALFVISYLKLPVLRSLYLGDGFWQDLAPDARSYFWGATIAAEEGFHTVAAWSPSPAFVKVLALWMRMVGTSPASAVLLNACAATSELLACLWR